MTPEEIAAMKAENEKLRADQKKGMEDFEKLKSDHEKLTNKPKDKEDDPEDPTLADKARKDRDEADKRGKYEKSLGAALKFNMGSAEFLKSNNGLLPKNIEGIFTQAEKEKYDSEIEKANAIKVGVVSEFFAVQSNHDLLTGPQKVELEDFNKLTKNVKQERIEQVYAMIFEPALETLRKVEKAKQVGSGLKDQSDAEKNLADRMMKLSTKHYLGDRA
jgi:hypothetical protein